MQDISCNWGSACKDNAHDIKGQCIRKPKGNAKKMTGSATKTEDSIDE
jgi:hypothetical protein